ncbi:MAG: DUF885 family protein, partial [Balneolaceae bacterium]
MCTGRRSAGSGPGTIGSLSNLPEPARISEVESTDTREFFGATGHTENLDKMFTPTTFYKACIRIAPILVLSLFGIFLNGGTTETDKEKLHGLMDEAEQFQIKENPFRSDDEGRYQENDRLQSVAIEDLERRVEFWKEIQDRLDTEVSRENLDLRGQITYDSFEREVNDHIKQYEYQSYLIPISHEGGFYNRMIGLENRVPLDSLQNYENYIARLHAIPGFFDQYIERMRKGIEIGYTLPRVIFVEEYDHYITTHIEEDPTQTGFY